DLLRDSVRTSQVLLETYPGKEGHRKALVADAKRLARLLRGIGDVHEAARVQEGDVTNLERLRPGRAPTPTPDTDGLANDVLPAGEYRVLGDDRRAAGAHGPARSAYRESVRRCRRLQARSPEVAYLYRSFEASARLGLGEVAADLGEVAEARRCYRE